MDCNNQNEAILKCDSKTLCQDLIGEHKTSYNE